MDSTIAQHIEEIRDVCSRFKVKELFLFGSAAKGQTNEKSDVDFLVTFDDVALEEYADNFFGLMYALQEVIQKNVDLVVSSSLTNPYLIESINETKILLYDKGSQEVLV